MLMSLSWARPTMHVLASGRYRTVQPRPVSANSFSSITLPAACAALVRVIAATAPSKHPRELADHLSCSYPGGIARCRREPAHLSVAGWRRAGMDWASSAFESLPLPSTSTRYEPRISAPKLFCASTVVRMV